MKSGALDAVPQEIIVRILHNCEYVTIIRFSLTCKEAYEMVSSSVSLQLHMELDINALEIPNGSWKGHPNYSLALQELRDYQAAWFNLRFSPMVRQHIISPDIFVPFWRVRHGTCYGNFRVSKFENGDSFEVDDSTQTAILGSSSIPPPVYYDIKFSYSRADPRQDLVVLIEDRHGGYGPLRFHLRSFTTGNPHPLAEHPILTISIDSDFLTENNLRDAPSSNDLRIMGNYLVGKVDWSASRSNISETLLWDWKTGILLSRIYQDSQASYTFLDKEHLLVYSTLRANDFQSTRFALLIYHIPNLTSDHKVPPYAQFQPSLYPKHRPTLIFELPELQPSWEIVEHDLVMGCDPVPGDVVYAKSAAFLCSHITTLGLCFRIASNTHQQPHTFGSYQRVPALIDYNVLVSARCLFAYMGGNHCEDATTRIIPWSQWGTTATRWFVEEGSTRHLIEGYRYQLIRSVQTDSSGAQFVTVVDVNPGITRRAYTYTPTSQDGHTSTNIAQMSAVLEGKGLALERLFRPKNDSAELPVPDVGEELNHDVFAETIGSDMETVIRGGFKHPVVSCLPYRVVAKLQPLPLHNYWQIRGEYLVGTPRQDWSGIYKSYLSLFKLDLPSED
ncbi:hypothetical protein OPQ81_008408 [Rhizoctonia solani]|nr:hypothetical protein OPQ81_008408 [Rhizoctonia solani]